MLKNKNKKKNVPKIFRNILNLTIKQILLPVLMLQATLRNSIEQTLLLNI